MKKNVQILSMIGVGLMVASCGGGTKQNQPENTNPVAYIVNNGNNTLLRCVISESNLQPTGCQAINGINLNEPINVAGSTNWLFITNFKTNEITQCKLSPDKNIVAQSCSNLTFLNTFGVTNPTGIAYHDGYVYIANLNATNKFTQCQVNTQGINISTCKQINLTGDAVLNKVIGVSYSSNGYLIFVNSGSNNYTECQVNTDGAITSSCTTKTPSNNGKALFMSPRAMYSVNNRAYFVDYTNSVVNCIMTENGVNNSSCVSETLKAPDDSFYVREANDITGFKNAIYILNSANSSYVQCTADAANISNCKYVENPLFNVPTGMTIL